ncbi:hypothetical protein [Microcoleus sp.]|uniref:hypothetical protein n=1 Tax=Microcoleus sp. TaxID=44472 RepID=UPI0035937624
MSVDLPIARHGHLLRLLLFKKAVSGAPVGRLCDFGDLEYTKPSTVFLRGTGR